MRFVSHGTSIVLAGHPPVRFHARMIIAASQKVILMQVFLCGLIFTTACHRQKPAQETSNQQETSSTQSQPSPAPLTDTTAQSKIRKLLVGTWQTDHGIMTYSADGTSSATFTNEYGRLAYGTMWDTDGTNVIITVTNVVSASTHHEAVGAREIVLIIALDETNLLWKSGGFQLSATRKQ